MDEFISNMTHFVSHAHASATNSDGPKSTSVSDINTTEQKNGMSISKSPESKRKKNISWNGALVILKRIGKV